MSVIPFLSDLDLSDSWFMLIGQDRMSWILVINWKGVTFWNILFFHSVVNGLAGCFFIKVFKRSLPLIRFWQFKGLVCSNPIFIKSDCNRRWAKTILVIGIVPFLGYLNFRFRRSVRIANHYLTWIGRFYRLSIPFWNFCFFHGILNSLTSFFLIQIREGISPVVGCRKFYLFTWFLVIRIELDLDALRTKAVLVFCISPFLGHCYTCLTWFVGVGNGWTFDSCWVVSNCIFCYRID